MNTALEECPRGVYHVVTIENQPPGRVRIKGVTITGGGANGDLADQDRGGGILIDNASPTVVRCTFTGNGGGDGGAVAVDGDSSEPRFVNCSFLRNTAATDGGAVHIDTGDIAVEGPDPFFANCVFSGNLTSGTGGAAFVSPSAVARLVNCTLSSNESSQGGAVFVAFAMPFEALLCATNSIFWNNIPNQIVDVPGTALISFSDVQGGGFAGDGNIDTDPLFEDELGPDMDPGTGDEDLRLDLMSPANDAGSTARVPADVGDLDRDGDFNERTPFDLGDNLRVALANVNAPSQCDRGDADMGAFENGDCDADGVRDADEADSNGDGVPEDCQDCNGNEEQDWVEIANNDSRDCNVNGIPDECELDGGCSLDADGDLVPDECTHIWQLKADFVDSQNNDSGVEGAAASLINGFIYVSHGLRDGDDSRSLSFYDIANDQWTHSGSSAPDAFVLRSELAGATADGRHYAIGGRQGGDQGAGPKDDLEEFDPAGSTWTERAPMASGARAGLGGASWNGRVYALGGRTGNLFGEGTILDTNEVYDPPPTDAWTPLQPLPTPVSDNYATLAHDGKIYVFGGATSPQTVTREVQIYDIQQGTWTFGAPMPTPRAAAMAGIINNTIVVFGGFDPDPCVQANLASTEIYDPIADLWFPGPPLVAPASEMAQGVTWDAFGVFAIGSGIFGAQESQVQELVLPIVCKGDVDGDNVIGVLDFLAVLAAWGPCAGCPEDMDNDGNVGITEFLFVLATWGSCPESGEPEPLTLDEELADACLSRDDWDEYVNVMTDPDSTQGDKNRYDCWMHHYIEECNRCQCPQTGHSGCPGPDPFGS